MDQQKFFEAVEVLDSYADMLCRRVRNDLGEAEDALVEQGVRPPGGPSPASAAGLCLSGIRQTIEELMNGCNLAYASLGQGEPFRMFFQYADAPAFARRQVRQLLARSTPAGQDAPADGEASSAAKMGTDSELRGACSHPGTKARMGTGSELRGACPHSCNTGAEDDAHIVEPATVVHQADSPSAQDEERLRTPENAPVAADHAEPSGREEPESVIDIQRFKKVKEVYFVEGIIEAYLPLRDEGSGLLRLEAVRSPGERDYLVAVYRQTDVPVAAPDGTQVQPAPQPRTVRVWAAYDLIRGTAPTAEGALRQVLGFLEMRCA